MVCVLLSGKQCEEQTSSLLHSNRPATAKVLEASCGPISPLLVGGNKASQPQRPRRVDEF